MAHRVRDGGDGLRIGEGLLVSDIAVSPELLDRWRTWLAPDVQPFFVASRRPWPEGVVDGSELSTELGHTYRTWRVDRSLEVLWLDEATFLDLDRARRTALVRAQVGHGRGAVPSVRRWSDLVDEVALRSQADGRRFVWWPSMLASDAGATEILSRVVHASPDGSAPDPPVSRHADVGGETWSRASATVPEGSKLAGSFPDGSGPNCFATVMGAAGVDGVQRECVLRAPFEEWLNTACRRGGRDDVPGTVFVWRNADGLPVHAAVTIGDGWALEKGSAEWWTPCAVRTVTDVIRAGRSPGQRLERHRIIA